MKNGFLSSLKKNKKIFISSLFLALTLCVFSVSAFATETTADTQSNSLSPFLGSNITYSVAVTLSNANKATVGPWLYANGFNSFAHGLVDKDNGNRIWSTDGTNCYFGSNDNTNALTGEVLIESVVTGKTLTASVSGVTYTSSGSQGFVSTIFSSFITVWGSLIDFITDADNVICLIPLVLMILVACWGVVRKLIKGV